LQIQLYYIIANIMVDIISYIRFIHLKENIPNLSLKRGIKKVNSLNKLCPYTRDSLLTV
jgi:hypothetical protein